MCSQFLSTVQPTQTADLLCYALRKASLKVLLIWMMLLILANRALEFGVSTILLALSSTTAFQLWYCLLKHPRKITFTPNFCVFLSLRFAIYDDRPPQKDRLLNCIAPFKMCIALTAISSLKIRINVLSRCIIRYLEGCRHPGVSLTPVGNLRPRTAEFNCFLPTKPQVMIFAAARLPSWYFRCPNTDRARLPSI